MRGKPTPLMLRRCCFFCIIDGATSTFTFLPRRPDSPFFEFKSQSPSVLLPGALGLKTRFLRGAGSINLRQSVFCVSPRLRNRENFRAFCPAAFVAGGRLPGFHPSRVPFVRSSIVKICYFVSPFSVNDALFPLFFLFFLYAAHPAFRFFLPHLDGCESDRGLRAAPLLKRSSEEQPEDAPSKLPAFYPIRIQIRP